MYVIKLHTAKQFITLESILYVVDTENKLVPGEQVLFNLHHYALPFVPND